MKKIFLLAFVVLIYACKKNRMCECSNANGTYDAGEVEATKMKAKKYCSELSTSTTTCKLK